MMSALIMQCRREYQDVPKSFRASKATDGSSTLFNTGRMPVLEGTLNVTLGTSARTENTHYTADYDNGDIQWVTVPGANLELAANFKYANWRDKNWVEAINQAIEGMNARGFFRQIVRSTFNISANVQTYGAPSACVDVYSVLESDNSTTSGNYRKLRTNWSYQQDANKIIFGQKPTSANKGLISYLRNLQTYAATSATLDVPDVWLEPVKKRAGAIYFRAMASRQALQGNANVDEGHFSFTSLRTQAMDLDNDFNDFAKRKKPTRPAKDISFQQSQGGVAD